MINLMNWIFFWRAQFILNLWMFFFRFFLILNRKKNKNKWKQEREGPYILHNKGNEMKWMKKTYTHTHTVTIINKFTIKKESQKKMAKIFLKKFVRDSNSKPYFYFIDQPPHHHHHHRKKTKPWTTTTSHLRNFFFKSLNIWSWCVLG